MQLPNNKNAALYGKGPQQSGADAGDSGWIVIGMEMVLIMKRQKSNKVIRNKGGVKAGRFTRQLVLRWGVNKVMYIVGSVRRLMCFFYLYCCLWVYVTRQWLWFYNHLHTNYSESIDNLQWKRWYTSSSQATKGSTTRTRTVFSPLSPNISTL